MQKPKAKRRDDYPPSEATKRRDDALRAALGTPAIPRKTARKVTKPKKKPDS